MAHMIINGRQIELDGEKNVLAVIRKAGIDIPTFCYDTDLSPYGACRLCLVENERGGMIAACSEVPFDGMVVKTNTEKLRKHRKLILELLLGSHCRDCLTCKRSEKCKLQELAIRFGVDTIRFPHIAWPDNAGDPDHIIEIDRNKCVLCSSCIRTCDERQNTGALNFVGRGSHMYVSTAFDKPLSETYCTGCGQCSVSCPTGAITVKDEAEKLWKAIDDDGLRTVALVDPQVVSAIGAEFGLAAGEDAPGRLVSALRRIGFDEVYDISAMAEEAEVSAFLDRFDEQGKLPWFSSWCPAWRKYVCDRHPDLQSYLSASDTPARAVGAAAAASGKELFITVIGPCTAHKLELLKGRGGQDINLIITALELVRIIKGMGLSLDRMAPEAPDALPGDDGAAPRASLSEAVLCAAGDRGVRAVTVYGLANAEEIVKQVMAGDGGYDFIEVLACPRGCETGAGQPRVFVKQRTQTEI